MNSVLNPEAPEFYPHLSTMTQGGYTVVNKTIRSCNSMPAGQSYNLFATFTDFHIVTYKLSENVIIQENQIIAVELPTVKLKRNDDESNTEKIVDANDNMLDRVHINLDTVTGVNQPSDTFLEGVASWNRTSEPVRLQVGSTTFIGAKNIPRPQLSFKDPVDNSDSLWVPKISDKPNNIKPLALNILYNEEGEAVGYEHPYQTELDLYTPPAHALSPAPSPPEPAPLATTPPTFVDTLAELDRLVQHLDTVSELAVDVEHHSYRTYQGITCLIQISTDSGGDFLIDALALREHVHKLNQAFTDPRKVKVLHGAKMDVLWLQRDFGVYLVGLFDTHQAARALGMSGLSLKYLLYKYCKVNADKRYQLADWRMRPLPAELVQYACQDTHYLLYIYRRMRNELLDSSAGEQRLRAVFEQSRQICGLTYNKEVVDESSHLQLYVRSKKSFNSQQLAALRLLYKWRDQHARELDESTTYLLPNHMLIALAEALPREMQGVTACCQPMPPFVKQNLVALHRIILSCRELPSQPELYPATAGEVEGEGRARGRAPRLQLPVHDLKHLPDFREEDIDLERGLCAARAAPPRPTPDVPAFTPAPRTTPTSVLSLSGSRLNVDAQLFVPPCDRYKKYRALAQVEELKDYKQKEAKIGAISQGDQLIKQEVLLKIQQAKSQVEAQQAQQQQEDQKPPPELRKRKISDKSTKDSQQKTNNNEHKAKNKPTDQPQDAIKPFYYKNINYKKFFDAEKTHKQPKMKSKKHK